MDTDKVNQDQLGLSSVVERFPEKRKSLERLFERDKLFRSLCEECVLSESLQIPAGIKSARSARPAERFLLFSAIAR